MTKKLSVEEQLTFDTLKGVAKEIDFMAVLQQQHDHIRNITWRTGKPTKAAKEYQEEEIRNFNYLFDIIKKSLYTVYENEKDIVKMTESLKSIENCFDIKIIVKKKV